MALVQAWSVDAGFVNNSSLPAKAITAAHAVTVWVNCSGDTITGLTDSVGTNTYVAHPSSPQTITGGTTCYAFRCLNHSGGAAVVISTVGGTGGQKGMVAAESSGRSTSAIDNSGFAATAASNTQTGPSFTVAAGADVLAADVLSFAGSSVTWTAGSGYTIPTGGTVTGSVSMPVCLETASNVSAGTYTPSFTNNSTNAGIIFAFSLPTGAGSNTLTAASGTYAMTGEAATLTEGGSSAISMLAGSGTYNLVGAVSTSDMQVDATAGSFFFSGQNASLLPVGPVTTSSVDPLPIPRARDWQSQSKRERERTQRIARKLAKARNVATAKPPQAEPPAPPIDTTDVPPEIKEMAARIVRAKATRELTDEERELMKFVPLLRALH